VAHTLPIVVFASDSEILGAPSSPRLGFEDVWNSACGVYFYEMRMPEGGPQDDVDKKCSLPMRLVSHAPSGYRRRYCTP